MGVTGKSATERKDFKGMKREKKTAEEKKQPASGGEIAEIEGRKQKGEVEERPIEGKTDSASRNDDGGKPGKAGEESYRDR